MKPCTQTPSHTLMHSTSEEVSSHTDRTNVLSTLWKTNAQNSQAWLQYIVAEWLLEVDALQIKVDLRRVTPVMQLQVSGVRVPHCQSPLRFHRFSHPVDLWSVIWAHHERPVLTLYQPTHLIDRWLCQSPKAVVKAECNAVFCRVC